MDYESIYGVTADGKRVTPTATDPAAGTVRFADPGQNFQVSVSDQLGNASLHQVTLTKNGMLDKEPTITITPGSTTLVPSPKPTVSPIPASSASPASSAWAAPWQTKRSVPGMVGGAVNTGVWRTPAGATKRQVQADAQLHELEPVVVFVIY